MKNYDWKYEFEKKKSKQNYKEKKAKGFRCSHCRRFVCFNEYMGTAHRNHCNYCLWSKHVDLNIPGDRKTNCYAGMKPIGLCFKSHKPDKYRNPQPGEIKIIHQCVDDGTFSTNRIAADDNSYEILQIFDNSLYLGEDLKKWLIREDIRILDHHDREEINRQLFGK